MPAHLVDLHCHLDLFPNFESALDKCEHEQVYTLAVTTTPKAWPRNRELAQGKKFVRAALGLHPQLVAERADEISLWESYLGEARYVGEVGLDAGPKFHQSLPRQRDVFRRILDCCADAGGKTLSVHSVRATDIVLDLIEKHLPSHRGRVVLHWFTGGLKEAQRAVELGCYFSINSAMMTKPTHRRMLSQLPIDRILTETDGPFTRTGSKPSEPSDVARVIDELARLRGLATTAMRDQVAMSFKRLVSQT